MSGRMTVVPLHRDCSALFRLPVLLHVVTFCGKSNTRSPSYFDHLRPQDIVGLEFPGVPEEGMANTAPRLPLHHLAPLTVRPALRCKYVNRGARHQEGFGVKIDSMHTAKSDEDSGRPQRQNFEVLRR